MNKKELRETLEEMGADTAKGMMDALCDGAVLAQIQPSDMSEDDFQTLTEDLYAEVQSAATLGRKGRAVNSTAQKAAARENGKKGGRPKERTLWVVECGEVRPVSKVVDCDGIESVLVVARSEGDALAAADAYDRGDIAIDNVVYGGETIAAIDADLLLDK